MCFKYQMTTILHTGTCGPFLHESSPQESHVSPLRWRLEVCGEAHALQYDDVMNCWTLVCGEANT